MQPSDHHAEQCFHCGLPVPASAQYSVLIAGKSQATCCRGCQAVAQMIVDSGNADYYKHRTALPATASQQDHERLLQQLQLYDLPEIQRTFVKLGNVSDGDVREASLILEGIVCAACVWLNERHVAQLPGVLSMDINYSTHRATVRWDNHKIQLSTILQSIRDIGYSAHPFDPQRQEEVFKRERAQAQRRLAIAGLGMMQIMMYAIPVYVADPDTMTWDIRALLQWASLMLTLPVVFYSAWPFFKGAWGDLRRRHLGMDVPVALGIGAAFGASLVAMLTHHGEVYFDSIAMFVFFLLLGRYLEMGVRRKSAAAVEALSKLIPAVATRQLDAQTTEVVPVARLQLGDILVVKPGESIPADGVVVSGMSDVDESLLTGESQSLSKQAGARLIGGAVNGASPLTMRVEKLGADTVHSSILRLLDRAQAEKPQIAMMADRVAAWFVLALLLIATAVALAWSMVDPSRAFWITVSVLVVTCPCALGLATPAALTAAAGQLSRLGLLITRGHALETLAKVTHVVFDKTGTLTLGRPALQETVLLGKHSADECRAYASALEGMSEHPIARALHMDDARKYAVSDLRNLPGQGLEGMIEGRLLRLGTPKFVRDLHGQILPENFHDQAGQTLVALGDAQGWLCVFLLGDQLRPDAQACVQRLQDLGVSVSLLSGDAQNAVAKVANRLGMQSFAGQLLPQDKLTQLRALQQQGEIVAMVGDGVNDAPVLAGAQVSIAMGQGAEAAQASADMVMMHGQLERLADAIVMARRCARVIRQNLLWAVLYNLAAIPAAALGLVTPWMAGIGMSMSSLLVVLNALRLSRSRDMRMGASAQIKMQTALLREAN